MRQLHLLAGVTNPAAYALLPQLGGSTRVSIFWGLQFEVSSLNLSMYLVQTLGTENL